MSEKGSGGTDSNFLNRFKDILRVPNNEEYSFDRLWNQRKRNGSKPLLLGNLGPNQEEVYLGLREYKKFLGSDYFLLGLFERNCDKYGPIGYLFAEQAWSGRSLFSDTIDKSKFQEFKNDPIFSPLTNYIYGGMTYVVHHEYHKRGLGTKMLEAMLDIREKVNAPELILNNVSGPVHRLADTLVDEGKIVYRWVESSGTLYIKRTGTASKVK